MKKLLKKLLGDRYLPCYVLQWKPVILFAYETDFLRSLDEFERALTPFRHCYLFLQLGWQHEVPSAADRLSGQLKEAQSRIPQLRITVLTNTQKEAQLLQEREISAEFCHQNAFLDERNYPLRHLTKRFDAIYIARLTPFKRHELAELIPSLHVINTYSSPKEQEYVSEIRQRLSHAVISPGVPGRRVSREIAEAHCGLCLSQEEGAMFVSAEYLLSGVPVVNTPGLGGREQLFPDYAVKEVPADPQAVAAAVASWKQNAPTPEQIRRDTLKLMEHHRRTLRRLVNAAIADARATEPDVPDQFFGRFPHKLGLRCTRLPWVNWVHGLLRRD